MKNKNITVRDVKHENKQAAETLKAAIHFQSMANYDEEPKKPIENINKPNQGDLLEEIEIY